MKENVQSMLHKLSVALHADDITLYVLTGKRSRGPVQIAATAHNQRIVNLRIPNGEGIVGWVADTGKPFISNNVHEEEKFYELVDDLSGYRTNSVLAVPIISKNTTIGVLEVINKTDGTEFTDRDAEIVRQATDLLLPYLPQKKSIKMQSPQT